MVDGSPRALAAVGPELFDRDVDVPAPTLADFKVHAVLASHEGISTCVALRSGAFGFSKRVLLKLADKPFDVAPDVNLRITQEARMGMRLAHPNLVQILDLSRDGGRTFLVREWVDGLGLRGLLRRRWTEGRDMPIEAALRVGVGVARALAYLHGIRARMWAPRGIAHRMVTPSNMLLSRAGEVRLANLSLADPTERFDSEARSVDGGFPAFCAPEVLDGATAGHAGDVWALGAVLFEALGGPGALQGDFASDWSRTRPAADLRPALQATASIDAALRSLLAWALDPVPDERPSAAALRDALRAYLQQTLQTDGEDELRAAVAE